MPELIRVRNQHGKITGYKAYRSGKVHKTKGDAMKQISAMHAAGARGHKKKK